MGGVLQYSAGLHGGLIEYFVNQNKDEMNFASNIKHKKKCKDSTKHNLNVVNVETKLKKH